MRLAVGLLIGLNVGASIKLFSYHFCHFVMEKELVSLLVIQSRKRALKTRVKGITEIFFKNKINTHSEALSEMIWPALSLAYIHV